MDPSDSKRPKIRKKNNEPPAEEDPVEAEGEAGPDAYSDEETTASKHMPKKNLQIEVIEHPEADEQPQNVESGDASGYDQTDPNQYSEVEEPNHRKGTQNEEQYADSMDAADNANRQSYQSFGNQESNGEQDVEEHEEHKIKQNAKNAEIKNKINEGLLNDFVKNKQKDELDQTQKVQNEQSEPHEYTEGHSEPDEDKIDDDLVEKQQREAEELLNEANQAVEEVDQDEYSIEEEEDEVEQIEKIAQENRIHEMNPEEEEEEDELEPATISSGNKFELNYTVGRIEDGAAILISKDHNLVEIPLCLLPSDIGPGNILKFSVDRNTKAEQKRVNEILSIQKQILENPNFFEE